jgi:hypothetical protein
MVDLEASIEAEGEESRLSRGEGLRSRLRTGLLTGTLVLGGLLAGSLLIEVGFRIWDHARGVDHRVYLQELTHSDKFALKLWAPTEPGPLSTIVERAYRHYPPFKPNVQFLATTADYSVIYRTNGKGLRDREYDYAKPAGVTRVLAFGDSFTFGTGVNQDERFTEVAEKSLDRVEVINMGVPGYGLDQILLSFLAQGVKYDPDLGVVFVTAPVVDRHRTGIVQGMALHIPDRLDAVEFSGESGGTAYLRPDDPLFTSSRSWFVRHSHGLAFLTYRLQVRRLRKQLEAEDDRFWENSRRVNASTPLREDFRAWRRARTTMLLRELQRATDAAGARLLVVNIDPRVTMTYLTAIPDLDLVDLAPELSARGATRPLTFVYDQHFNPDANRFIGERLAQELRRRLGRGTS